MAIFHFSVKSVRRSEGRSIVAAMAYRAGVRLVCQRTGRVHDYRRRSGVVRTLTLAPGGAVLEREKLCNAMERAETRINSVVGREFEIGLPHELDEQARFALAVSFTGLLVERYGVVADLAIHAPSMTRRRREVTSEVDIDAIGQGPDERNHHGHILTSTRPYLGEGYEFGAKNRTLDGLKSGAIEIAELRAEFAGLCNAALEAAGRPERVDHRSNLARGIDAVPLGKIGVAATGLERRTGEKSDRRLMLEAQQSEIQDAFAALDSAETEERVQAASDEGSDPRDRRDLQLGGDRAPEQAFVASPSRMRRIELGSASLPIELQETPRPKIEIQSLDPARRQAHLEAFAALRRNAAAVDRAILQKLLDAGDATEMKRRAEAITADDRRNEPSTPIKAVVPEPAPRAATHHTVSASTPDLVQPSRSKTDLAKKAVGRRDRLAPQPAHYVRRVGSETDATRSGFSAPTGENHSAPSSSTPPPPTTSRRKVAIQLVAPISPLPIGAHARPNDVGVIEPERERLISDRHRAPRRLLSADTSTNLRGDNPFDAPGPISSKVAGGSRAPSRSSENLTRAKPGTTVSTAATSSEKPTEASSTDVHAAAIALWASTLEWDAEGAQLLDQMLRLVAAAIGVGQDGLAAATTRILGWIRSGRVADLVDRALVAALRLVAEVRQAAKAPGRRGGTPIEIPEADSCCLRELVDACGGDTSNEQATWANDASQQAATDKTATGSETAGPAIAGLAAPSLSTSSGAARLPSSSQQPAASERPDATKDDGRRPRLPTPPSSNRPRKPKGSGLGD